MISTSARAHVESIRHRCRTDRGRNLSTFKRLEIAFSRTESTPGTAQVLHTRTFSGPGKFDLFLNAWKRVVRSTSIILVIYNIIIIVYTRL